ncbi:MAG TPA: energy transducer TonB [Pseudomonas sp.]|uniref:energy transducer TonB n=1 Tax=Pseudomonas sp. TaxID=306 RepID=UPI002ED99F09
MSDIEHASSIGYLTYAGDYSVRNTQTLSGVTQLWQDAFARAMAQQIDETSGNEPGFSIEAATDSMTVEPIAGAKTLGKIVDQRALPVEDIERNPPEPLFLPIAEFEWDLADKPAKPFSASELIEQQRHLEFDSSWVRPTVLSPYDDSVEPGPGPEPRPLFLPIAEFEWDLADKPAQPFSVSEMIDQQRNLDFDTGWARPIVLQNLRQAA